MKGRIDTLRWTSPCGEMMLGAFEDRLCLCGWSEELHPGRVERRLRTMLRAEFHDSGAMDIPAVLQETVRQLEEYFHGLRRTFDIPILLAGTDFQRRVWQYLPNIPYGRTLSYGELAATIGSPQSVRAVANANGANAISIILPCHRIVGGDGSLTGYGGGIAAKRFLLELEHCHKDCHCDSIAEPYNI